MTQFSNQNNTIPENLSILPQDTFKQRKSRWFWLAIIGAVFAAGILILRFAGGIFIKEIIQEVVIEERIMEFSEIGLPASYFELSNLKSEKVKIGDFLGSPVVLTFWTTWNILSVDQIRILSEVESTLFWKDEIQSQETSGKLFKILAINSQEDQSMVSNFIGRGGYNIEVLLDESGAVGEMYKIQTLPVTYFLDKIGNIADIYVGLLDAESIVDKVGKILSNE